jgi:DNA-binding NtrC family response regulator
MGQARTFLVQPDAEAKAEQESSEDSQARSRVVRSEEPEQTHIRRSDVAPADAPNSTGRILLVDDHAELRRVWIRVLRRAGHEVEEATSAREALKLLAERSFDLVLSDIQMPDMTGLELLAKVRALDPELAVVLLTGAPEAASVARANELGASDYLTKPIDLARLTATVGRCVAQTLKRRS